MSLIRSRQDLANQGEVRPEVIAFAPVTGALHRRRLPAAGVDIDAIPLPALCQGVATGFVIGRLIEMTVDGERNVFFEVEPHRWNLWIFRREDDEQVGGASNVMPDGGQDVLVGNHPVCVLLVERDALLEQLLRDIIYLLGDDLL